MMWEKGNRERLSIVETLHELERYQRRCSLRRSFFCLVMAAILLGCGAPPNSGINSQSSLSVTPATATLRVDDVLQLQATSFSPATNQTTTPKGTWSSSDMTVVTVNSTGAVLGLSEGQATVTFLSSSGESAAATIGVTPRATSLTISPPNANMNSGTSFQFSATAVIDGKDQDVTSLADWSIDNSLLQHATISRGLVAVDAGAVSTLTVIHVTVSYAGLKAGAALIVNP
jgi:Bacterial Ig-like domain (group 2)